MNMTLITNVALSTHSLPRLQAKDETESLVEVLAHPSIDKCIHPSIEPPNPGRDLQNMYHDSQITLK